MRRDLRCFFFIREECLESLNVSEIPLQRQHFLLSYFKTLKVNFFWSWILKNCIEVQEKRNKVVVLSSRSQQNVELGISTSKPWSGCKETYKVQKRDARAKARAKLFANFLPFSVMSIGEHRHCCVTFEIEGFVWEKKNYRFRNLRKWKNFSKKQLTLLKMCVRSLLCGPRADFSRCSPILIFRASPTCDVNRAPVTIDYVDPVGTFNLNLRQTA